MSSKAVFLDRDGTIIEDCGYVRRPEDVRLLPGAGQAVRRLAESGHLIVVISNQSGIARGLLDEDTLSRVHRRMEELLREHDAPLHGVYYCPYLDGPEAVVPAYRKKSDLRKPGDGMLRKAAKELDIDLSQSWLVGDSPTDVQAGVSAGCRTILIQKNGTSATLPCTPTHQVKSLAEAADLLTAANPAPGPHQEADRACALLQKISDQIEQAQRRTRQHDFSVLRLVGALVQMFAIVAALWGVAAILDHASSEASARFALACFLQLASLTAFAIDRFR